MKTKTVLFILAMMGIVLFGCTSSPSGNSSQIRPSFDGFTPDGQLRPLILEPNPNSLPQYNQDGSVTAFTVNGIAFKFMPMTFSGSSRGALTRTTDEFDALIKQYEANLAANPQDYDTCIMLAGLYIDRGNNPGDADMAIKYSDQALAINNNDSDALYARALAYNAKGDDSSRAMALSDLEIVLRTNIQRMKGVYYVMGMINYKSDKIDEAIEAFEKVRAIDPGFIDTDEILEVLYSYKN